MKTAQAIGLSLLCAGVAAATAAHAQNYPNRPIRIINTPEMKDRLATLAFTPVGDTRQQFSSFIQSEIAKWGKAVRESGAKAE